MSALLEGLGIAVGVVGLELLIAWLLRRRRHAPPRWDAVRQRDHIIDTTPKLRSTRKWL